MARHESANPQTSDDNNRRSQLYHDMPSVTPRAWGPMPPDDAMEVDPVDLGSLRSLRDVPLVPLEQRTDVVLLEGVEQAPASLGVGDAHVQDVETLR